MIKSGGQCFGTFGRHDISHFYAFECAGLTPNSLTLACLFLSQEARMGMCADAERFDVCGAIQQSEQAAALVSTMIIYKLCRTTRPRVDP